MDEVEEFLIHYGVKGMKWGKRKAATESGLSQLRRAKGDSSLKDAVGKKSFQKKTAGVLKEKLNWNNMTNKERVVVGLAATAGATVIAGASIAAPIIAQRGVVAAHTVATHPSAKLGQRLVANMTSITPNQASRRLDKMGVKRNANATLSR